MREENQRGKSAGKRKAVAAAVVIIISAVFIGLFVFLKKAGNGGVKVKAPEEKGTYYKVLSVGEKEVLLDGPRGNLRLSRALAGDNMRIGQVLSVKRSKEGKIKIAPVAGGDGIKTFSAREIVENSLNWIERQKLADGYYEYHSHYADICGEQGEFCLNDSSKNVFKVANMWVVLARLSYYRNFSHDAADLARAEKDAQMLMDFCRDDMSSCVLTLYPLIKLYEETNNKIYRDFVVEMSGFVLEDLTIDNQELPENIRVMHGSLEIRALAKADRVFGGDANKDAVRQMLIKLRRMGPTTTSCHLVLAQTEVGMAYGNRDLLSEARKVLRGDWEGKSDDLLNNIQPCIEALFELSEYRQDRDLLELAEVKLEKYIGESWDGPGMGGKYGEGGFRSDLRSKDSSVNLTDTGYMAYILGFAPQKKYIYVKN